MRTWNGVATKSGWVVVAGLCLGALVGCGDDETGGASTTGTAQGGNGGSGTGNSGGTGNTGGGSGGSGGSGNLLNGCSEAMAIDHTGEATVSISDIQAWGIPHQVCVLVDVGTTVEWDGSFSLHPLSGGSPGAPDASSPITDSDQSGGTASVTLSTAGEYPYFCTIHNATMQGVIYVQ